MITEKYMEIVKSFIHKSGQDIGFRVDIIETTESAHFTTFKSQFWFQVITDTETDSGIEWRSVPVYTEVNNMGMMRGIGDNEFNAVFELIRDKVRLQEPLAKAKSVLYIGQSIYGGNV